MTTSRATAPVFVLNVSGIRATRSMLWQLSPSSPKARARAMFAASTSSWPANSLSCQRPQYPRPLSITNEGAGSNACRRASVSSRHVARAPGVVSLLASLFQTDGGGSRSTQSSTAAGHVVLARLLAEMMLRLAEQEVDVALGVKSEKARDGAADRNRGRGWKRKLPQRAANLPRRCLQSRFSRAGLRPPAHLVQGPRPRPARAFRLGPACHTPFLHPGDDLGAPVINLAADAVECGLLPTMAPGFRALERDVVRVAIPAAGSGIPRPWRFREGGVTVTWMRPSTVIGPVEGIGRVSAVYFGVLIRFSGSLRSFCRFSQTLRTFSIV